MIHCITQSIHDTLWYIVSLYHRALGYLPRDLATWPCHVTLPRDLTMTTWPYQVISIHYSVAWRCHCDVEICNNVNPKSSLPACWHVSSCSECCTSQTVADITSHWTLVLLLATCSLHIWVVAAGGPSSRVTWPGGGRSFLKHHVYKLMISHFCLQFIFNETNMRQKCLHARQRPFWQISVPTAAAMPILFQNHLHC